MAFAESKGQTVTAHSRSSLGAVRLGIAALAVAIAAGCSMGTGTSATGMPPAAVAGAVTSNPAIAGMLDNSCYDCHSDRGAASWNASLAPSYLFGTSKAREVLDFTAWEDYGPQRRSDEITAIAKAVSEGSMPPGDYGFFHPSAKLSEEQKQALAKWAAQKVAQSAH